MLGIGPFPAENQVDTDLINAGKQTVTYLKGASFFDSLLSFAMIRSEHVDLTVLGAFEVSQDSDLSYWKVPGKLVKGMGGSMDLVASAKNIIVAMQHTNKGQSKILKKYSLPLTCVICVKMVVTDLSVMKIENGAFFLLDRALGVSIEEIQNATDSTLIIEDDIPEMKL